MTSLPLAFSGLALIGLSMDRHARQAAFKAQTRWQRSAGWLLLILSLASIIGAANWRFALIEWIGLAGAAAGLVVATLYYRPRLLAPLAIGGCVLGLIGWVLRAIV